MCLIAFALHASSRWPLVIAANRDEYLNRPTVPLARWKTPQGHEIVSGRDLRAGGAWFGLTAGGPGGPGGRIAFLTNVREAVPAPSPRSRGELVTRWLESPGDAEAFTSSLTAAPDDFAGFNLVIGDWGPNPWRWVTNRAQPNGSGWQHQALTPGVYGLSNAALDSPWPKTTRLKSVLGQSLQAHEPGGNLQALQADLWQALGSRERASGADFPAPGMARAREEALSSAFVEFPDYGYGTRSSTLLTASSEPGGWAVQMEEREHLRTAPQPGQAPSPDWQARQETMHWSAGNALPGFTAA